MGNKKHKKNRQPDPAKEALQERAKAEDESKHLWEYQQQKQVLFSSAEGAARVVTSIFVWIGAILLGIGLILVLTATPEERRVYTTATIERIEAYQKSDGETEERVFVSYDVGDRHYVKRLGYYRADFYEGQEIQIFYDRLNPGKIGSKEGNVFTVILLGVMGVAFLWIGISMKVKHHLGPIHRDRLREKGRRIEADFEGVGNGVVVNGAHGYFIKCRWFNTETGAEYHFRSIEICGDPTEKLRMNGISKIPVLINPDKPKQYYVDVEELRDRVFQE